MLGATQLLPKLVSDSKEIKKYSQAPAGPSLKITTLFFFFSENHIKLIFTLLLSILSLIKI